MHHPSAMLARLDAETRELQPIVDEPWLDLMAAGVTTDQYVSHLARVYGFEAPVECALAYTPHLILADRLDTMRAGLIAQDLVALGARPSQITALAQCTGIGPFADPAEALGWKYVLERPTQLHGAVKRNLVGRLTGVANACTYLSLHEGIAAARWQQLGMLLDGVAERPGMRTRMIDAARVAFAMMASWFRKEQGSR